MVYTKGYYEGAETFLIPKTIKDFDYEDDTKNFSAIYTISLNIETRILLEAYLLMLNIESRNTTYRKFREYTKEINSPFVARCVLMEQRFRMLKGRNTSKLEMIFFICENADYFLDDKILIDKLDLCVNRAICSKHLDSDFMKRTRKDTIYYMKKAGEDLPQWVNPLFTFINISTDRPTILADTDELFTDFPVNVEDSLNGFLNMELKKLLNSLVNQMIFTTESYEQIVKLENVPAVAQRYIESIALEYRCTGIGELITKLEEVLK